MPPAYFVEGLFPIQRTSIICGPSGAGKSRWLLPAIADWKEGKPVLGRKSTPLKCGYLACDRPSSDTKELIEIMELDTRLQDMKIVSLMDGDNDFDYSKIAARHFPPGSVDVLFIEAFQALMPQGEINNYWKVLDFMRKWHQFCQRHNYSVLGSVHSPKMTENNGYTLQRDQIMGTAAWGASLHGIINLNFHQPGDINCTLRKMSISPKNGKPWEVMLDFDERGYLVESKQNDDMLNFMLDQEVKKLTSGSTITTTQIKQWAMLKHIPERSMYRWIKETPLLEKADRGLYKVRFTT